MLKTSTYGLGFQHLPRDLANVYAWKTMFDPYIESNASVCIYVCMYVCMYVWYVVCIPILVTTFPEWLSGMEPLPHTPGAVRPSSLCLLFCVHMHSFAGLIRRTPPPTLSDTAITDRHSDTTIFQLRAHWVRMSWSIGLEKSLGHVPPVRVEPSTPCMQGEHPIH